MKSNSTIILILGLGLLLSSCEDDKNTSLPLTGCCNNDPLIVFFGNAELFLPNIFTPNNDGVNDRFIPIGDSIREIIDFEIKDALGLTVFHHYHIPLWNDNSAWDGYVHGRARRGLYSYTITVEAMNGIVKTFSGKVCNFPCDYPSKESISKENCFSQDKWECLSGPWICEFSYDCFN